MSANLATTADGRTAFAFTGAREDIWHRQGQQIEPGQGLDEWAHAAGLDWTARMARVEFQPEGSDIFECFPCQRVLYRSDTGAPLGIVGEGYKVVQPRDVLAWFTDYVGVDDRFQLDAAGALGNGEKIWATAVFNGGMDVGGSAHKARLLMSTSFDGSQATRNQGTVTRVVCQNTLRLAQSDKRAVITTRHSTQFQPATVARELGEIAKGFEQFKAMGDAMALIAMSAAETSQFFKTLLEIPFDAKAEDVTARKINQFRALNEAYSATIREGTEKLTAWCALNAVTRYVDHDRASRRGDNDNADTARFVSANFGTGDAMKQQAVSLLRSQYALAA